MSRASWVLRWLASLAILFSTPLAMGAGGREGRPNIVYILADDLGYGDVRCLNPAGKIATPNLDRLAAAGMVFTDAHSGSAVCFADPVRHPDRPICLAVAAPVRRAGRLQPAADRAGPPHRGRAAPPGRLPDDRHRQVAPRHGLGAAGRASPDSPTPSRRAPTAGTSTSPGRSPMARPRSGSTSTSASAPRWTWCRTRSSRTTASPRSPRWTRSSS